MENSGLSPHAIEFTPSSVMSYKENQIVVDNEKEKVDNNSNNQYEYTNTMYQSYQKEKKSSKGSNRKKNRTKKEDIRKIVNRQLTLNVDTIEATVNVMEEHNIDAYLVQETNMRGSWENLIERDSGSYLILHHNHDEDANGRGVAIFLSPAFVMAYERAGRLEPVTTGATGQFCGRFIGIWISHPNYDSYGKRIRGDMKLFLASAHYPKSNTSVSYMASDTLKYEQFTHELSELLLESEPYDKNFAEILSDVQSPYDGPYRLIGNNMNTNVGKRDCEEEESILGPYGNKGLVDAKGVLARRFLMSQNLRVLNTFFIQKAKGVEDSHLNGQNIMTSSLSLFKKVRNCQSKSNVAAVVTDISFTSIKHTGKKQYKEAVRRHEMNWLQFFEEPGETNSHG